MSISTTPSGLMKVAPTGQTCVQGESAQWLHSFGTKKFFAFPVASHLIGECRRMPPLGESTIGCSMSSGVDVVALDPGAEIESARAATLFSALQARTQLPQPMHFSMSIDHAPPVAGGGVALRLLRGVREHVLERGGRHARHHEHPSADD